MKKILRKICLTLFMASLYITPASAALIIDGTQITGVVNKYVTKIMEITEKVTQQIDQVKLMASQGYNWDSLKELAKDYYNKNGLPININFKQEKDLVAGTKAKKLEAEEAKAKEYTESSIKLYETKQENAKKDQNTAQKQLEATTNAKNKKEKECNSLQTKYNQMESDNSGSGEEVFIKLAECNSELERLKNEAAEWEAQEKSLKEIIKNIDEQLEKFKENKDPIQQANAKRIEALENDQAEEDSTIKIDDNGSKEWDSEDALDSYQINDTEYQAFMLNYFYDSKNLNSGSIKGLDAEKDKSLAYENYINRIMRNRRYLFVNTAVHLLQVATTIRRELPAKIETADTMFEQVINPEGELEAIIGFSNTRIENAKALLLYAKLLSAKIQYLAARDLINAELKKEIFDENGTPKKYQEFNLEKYILTDEYVGKMQEDAKRTISTEELENVKPEMWK